jgi:hypothetical protein
MSSENNLALQRPLLTDGPHSIPMDSFRWGGGNLIKTICPELHLVHQYEMSNPLNNLNNNHYEAYGVFFHD